MFAFETRPTIYTLILFLLKEGAEVNKILIIKVVEEEDVTEHVTNTGVAQLNELLGFKLYESDVNFSSI